MTTQSTAQSNVNLPQVTVSNQADESKLAVMLLGRMNEVARVTNLCNFGGDVVSVVNYSSLYHSVPCIPTLYINHTGL